MTSPRTVNAPAPDFTPGTSTSTNDDTPRNSRPRPASRSGAYRKRVPIKVRAAEVARRSLPHRAGAILT